MQHEPDFYQAILDDPTNLDIRLVYADWLEDHYYLNQDYYDYSQLIRLQINNEQYKKQCDKERELLNKFKEEFHGLKLEYHNGFIEYVYDDLSHPDIFRLLLNKYPIRGMRLILYEGFLKLYLEYTEEPRWKFIEELELNYYFRVDDFKIIERLCYGKKKVMFYLDYHIIGNSHLRRLKTIIQRLKKSGLEAIGIENMYRSIPCSFYQELNVEYLDTYTWKPLD